VIGFVTGLVERIKFVVLPWMMAELHLVTRFDTFTDPRPVASSYPTPAVKPVSPGMFVLPDVVSLKMQVLPGSVVLEPSKMRWYQAW
jgi:hypothetical protein